MTNGMNLLTCGYPEPSACPGDSGQGIIGECSEKIAMVRDCQENGATCLIYDVSVKKITLFLHQAHQDLDLPIQTVKRLLDHRNKNRDG
jgi:hypothetical protein